MGHPAKGLGTNLLCCRAKRLHQIRVAATTGPKAWSRSESAIFPFSAAAVARVRKHVGQGNPVSSRSGQVSPGKAGWLPLSHR